METRLKNDQTCVCVARKEGSRGLLISNRLGLSVVLAVACPILSRIQDEVKPPAMGVHFDL